jgi:predicted enzyme related to lactoylglutathione lyase
MTNPHGYPIWYELLTPDHAEAKRFYEAVVGWEIGARPDGDMDYRMIGTGTGQVGGVMALTDAMKSGGAKPGWQFYIGVDDVDATAAAVTAAGGAVLMPAFDLPGVGRMALIADPQGAAFYVMRGASDAASTAFQPGETATSGHAVWNELSSSDPDGAIGFYTRVFGWRQEGAMPMRDLGEYRFLQAGTVPIGAAMGLVDSDWPGWLFYFLVPDIDAATARVRDGGGTVVQEPIEIPGGGFSMVARDPHGVRFGLVGSRHEER